MTTYDALKLALRLAVTAPTEAKSQLCVALAESIATQLKPEEVERAKVEVEAEVDSLLGVIDDGS
jgi:hypothetical protein